MNPSPVSAPGPHPLWRAGRALALVAGVWGAGLPAGVAQVHTFDAAPPGLVEAGAPLFVVLGPEALGLSSPPTDLHLLPDGRLLLAAGSELAIGDGVRWSVLRQESGDTPSAYAGVAVDAAGTIYAGVMGGFARFDFGTEGRWRLRKIAPWPDGEKADRPILREVIAAGDDWYWHSESGALIAWRPGQAARTVGQVGTLEHVFRFGTGVFFSDRTDGTLLRMDARGQRPVLPTALATPDETITCSTPFEADRLLVGTHGRGLQIFDGMGVRAFCSNGLLTGAYRINDLCPTEGGGFAAALDNLGIVFFDRQGRTLQVLDRALDHRLARVRRLFALPGGVVWALLNEGVVRVAYPSPVSYFEPLIPSGLTTAHPFRCDGRLWVMADGRMHRGVYDRDGRLLRFEPDGPAGRFIYASCVSGGAVLVGTDAGVYRRMPAGWQLSSPLDLINVRVVGETAQDGWWLYAALGEIGWMRPGTERAEWKRTPVPELGNAYAAVTDAQGLVWLELGAGRFARVRPGGPERAPEVEIFGAQQGLPESWVLLFELDGVVRVNVADQVFRFDEATRRLIPDTEFAARFPEMGILVGRPLRDARGRLWLGGGGSVQVYAGAGAAEHRVAVGMPPRLRPYFFTCESDGVVWIRDALRLLRYDPAMPEVAPSPLRALITEVTLTTTGRILQVAGPELPALRATDNSLAVRFLAPGNPFGAPVSFETRLEGGGNDWVATGSGGTAAFNGLAPGRYRLHVRPRAGSVVGEEAGLGFTILAPWYRTPVALVGFTAAGLGLVVFAVWYASSRQRREKARLERLVGDRTRELHESNRQLLGQIEETLRKATELRASEERAVGFNATLRHQIEETLRKAGELQASEERFRRLNEELEQRVGARTAELVASNRELEAFSYSVSHDLRAPLRNISGFADLLRRRIAAGGDAENDRYLGTVSSEAQRLGQLIDSLLSFSRLGRAELRRQPVALKALAEAVRTELAVEQGGRSMEWRIGELPVVDGDPTLLRQVLANLLGNALKFSRGREPAIIEVGVQSLDGAAEVEFFVRDNGAGFDPKYSEKLFGVFQRLHSTKEFAGSGIGLANVRRIVTRHGGRVWAEGAVGQGATFHFTLPVGGSAPVAGRI